MEVKAHLLPLEHFETDPLLFGLALLLLVQKVLVVGFYLSNSFLQGFAVLLVEFEELPVMDIQLLDELLVFHPLSPLVVVLHLTFQLIVSSGANLPVSRGPLGPKGGSF